MKPTVMILAVTAIAWSGCSKKGDYEPPKMVVTVDAVIPEEDPAAIPPTHRGILVGPAADVVEEIIPEEGAALDNQAIEELAMHQPKIHTVTVRPNEDLRLFSEWSGVSANDLKLQNSGNQPVYGKKYYIPLSHAELENFQQRREQYWLKKTDELYEQYKVIPEKYTVRKGDTLLGVSKKRNCPLWFIVRMNENLNPYQLSVGDELIIPRLEEKKAGDTVEVASTHVGLEGDVASVFEVIVLPGETASKFASWAGITVEDIEKSNRQIKNINSLRVGDRIRLPITAKQQQMFLEKRGSKKRKK